MLFKRFDVDVNWVQIDDDVIPRPAYISAGQWIEFWDEVNAIEDQTGWNDGYSVGYDDAMKESEKEHKAEVEHIEDQHAREISKLEDQHAREISKLEEEIASLEAQIENLEEDRRNAE